MFATARCLACVCSAAADEQPFTRDPYAVRLPLTVKRVLVEAGDQKYAYHGRTVEVALPGR